MLRSQRTILCAVGVVALFTGLTGCAKEAVETIEQGKSSACATDLKTMELAVEVYYANGGAPGTATIDGLVSAGLLREPSSTYVVAPDGQTVMPIPGGLCDTAGDTAGGSGGDAGSLSAAQCEADRQTLQAAVDAFGTAYGVSPMDEAELVRAQMLGIEVVGYDLQGATVVPAPGACA